MIQLRGNSGQKLDLEGLPGGTSKKQGNEHSCSLWTQCLLVQRKKKRNNSKK